MHKCMRLQTVLDTGGDYRQDIDLLPSSHGHWAAIISVYMQVWGAPQEPNALLGALSLVVEALTSEWLYTIQPASTHTRLRQAIAQHALASAKIQTTSSLMLECCVTFI